MPARDIYVCIECGAEVEFEEIVRHGMKCIHCKEKRSNIWVKKKLPKVRVVIAR